ncbi:MAG: radical SAM domain-containing protein [Ilumatobacteraceae bacterium]
MSPIDQLRGARTTIARFERSTRPIDPEVTSALARRWDELPPSARTPAQVIGRRSAGCEGTHGVFPQCNFGCRPCYHSEDANRVRIDGPHTIANVDAQMAFARSQRGPGQFAQLIGGEVSLLDPDDHAAALAAMHRHRRTPMSFTHGDFDYEYLERLAVGRDGTRRFDHLSFAIHIDTTMTGRRSVNRPTTEAALDPERARVAGMFDRLRREHGVRSYLAHNMTVTPENLDEVPDVIANNRRLGYRMFSFQPAAYIGREQRWDPGYRGFGDDDVWARIEAGAGRTLPHQALQFGDLRCNRITWGVFVGDRYVPVLDENDPRDLRTRDRFLTAIPGTLGYGPPLERAVRVTRSVVRQPGMTLSAAGWAARFVRRAGGIRQPWRDADPVTFVMHRFMDAADVAAAWTHVRDGRMPDDERLVETAERLQACAYSMPHPETGEMVPACVQHGVLDPVENTQLVELLPRRSTREREPGLSRSSS